MPTGNLFCRRLYTTNSNPIWRPVQDRSLASSPGRVHLPDARPRHPLFLHRLTHLHDRRLFSVLFDPLRPVILPISSKQTVIFAYSPVKHLKAFPNTLSRRYSFSSPCTHTLQSALLLLLTILHCPQTPLQPKHACTAIWSSQKRCPGTVSSETQQKGPIR